MPGSYVVAARAGVHSLASASSTRSAGTAAYVIEIGQPWPGSVCDQARNPAARRTWACSEPASLCSHGAACSPCPTARVISQCHDGWKRDLVDPVAEAVVGRQLRLVGVGEHPVLASLRGPGLPTERGQVVDDLRRGVTGDGLDERGVGPDHVVADQRRRLVGGHPVRHELATFGEAMRNTVEAGPLVTVSACALPPTVSVARQPRDGGPRPPSRGGGARPGRCGRSWSPRSVPACDTG